MRGRYHLDSGRFRGASLVAMAGTLPGATPGTPPLGCFQTEEMTETALRATIWAPPSPKFVECSTWYPVQGWGLRALNIDIS